MPASSRSSSGPTQSRTPEQKCAQSTLMPHGGKSRRRLQSPKSSNEPDNRTLEVGFYCNVRARSNATFSISGSKGHSILLRNMFVFVSGALDRHLAPRGGVFGVNVDRRCAWCASALRRAAKALPKLYASPTTNTTSRARFATRGLAFWAFEE